MKLPWNQPVELPRDLLPVLPLTIAFGIVHALLKQRVFYPLASKYLQEPAPKNRPRKPSSGSPNFHGEQVSPKERRLQKKKEDEDSGLLGEKFAIAAWNFTCHTFLL